MEPVPLFLRQEPACPFAHYCHCLTALGLLAFLHKHDFFADPSSLIAANNMKTDHKKMRVRTGAIIIKEKKFGFIRSRLALFWVRSWLLDIYFDSMKIHQKILQWLSIFLFYLDSQLFLHPILQIHQLSIWYVYVHQINNLLLHELNQKWFHNATTYILLHCKCTNCEKSSKLECGMYILDFFSWNGK